MLSETSLIDKIEVLLDGQIQVRRAYVISRDGVEVARVFHRHVLGLGADLTNEDARVKAVATAVWAAEKERA